MSDWLSPSWARARPNASRTDLPILRVAVVMSGSQEFQRLGGLGLGQRLSVVVGVLRQNRLDRPTLDGAGHDHAGLALRCRGLVERCQHFVEVVAVDLLGGPAERLP